MAKKKGQHGPSTCRVQVYMDCAAFERLRKLAFQRHVTVSSLVREAIDRWLSRAD